MLGFVGIDGAGLGGVEQFYDKKITGEPGQLFIEKDSQGNPYESAELPGKPGQTIVLTLDHSIQYRAEQALLEAVARSRAKSEQQSSLIHALAKFSRWQRADV